MTPEGFATLAFVVVFLAGAAIGAAAMAYFQTLRLDRSDDAQLLRASERSPLSIDYVHLKSVIEREGLITCRPVIDWAFVSRALEAEGYDLVRKPVH